MRERDRLDLRCLHGRGEAGGPSRNTLYCLRQMDRGRWTLVGRKATDEKG